MGYGETNITQLSYCAAKWLDAHAYFNTHQDSFNENTTMIMHTPIALPSNTIRLRFEVTDTDELHQAQLIIPTHPSDSAGGIKIHSCKTLKGETQNVEFTIPTTTEVSLYVIDVKGNFTQQTYPIIPVEILHVDVNMDGVVDVADLVLVASDFGSTAVRGAISNPDVNNDGVVNRADLLLVVEVLESDESIPMEPTSTTTINLAPTTVSSPAIGEQFTLSLNILAGQNVAGYQATVQFDATALRYVESSNGDYLPTGAFFIPPIAEGNTVKLAAASLAGETIGDGRLATITFEVVAVKPSTVSLTGALLTDNTGSISIPQSQPSEITAPPRSSDIDTTVSLLPANVQSPKIGEQLMLSVNITNGEDVAAYQATVQFDTTALQYVESSNGDYLPTGALFFPPIAEGNTVTIAASSLAGETMGDGTLATIIFEVVAVKASTLLLSDVLLTDSTGVSSVPQTENAEITDSSLPPEDVNEDGVVNIIDLTLVASNFGKQGTNDGDVNGDGVVNIVDLTLVASAFGNTAAAPLVWGRDVDFTPMRADVATWLKEARQLNPTDPDFQRGLLVLENLLKTLTPKETALLPNYPNPFNPETWIPYQLATPADVTVSIFTSDGKLIRMLDLGHQPIGIYQHRSNAAHWNGKNTLGEPVASGLYFYTFTAGDFTATRKMLIRK